MKLYETITAENWHKAYDSRDSERTTPTCLFGHLTRLPGNADYWCPRLESVYEAVVALYPERTESTYGGVGMAGTIGLFNDHPDTTFEDIQRVLKVADV